MDTIKQHSKRLTRPFTRSKNSDDIITSAKKMAVLVLQSEELHMKHRKKILKELLWWISEADGKYTTRYRSKAVVDLATKNPDSSEKIQHEHVFPRAKVADDLLNRRSELLVDKNELERILDGTVGCVVLASEHRQLDNKAEGWKRYAKITVLDMSKSPPNEVQTCTDLSPYEIRSPSDAVNPWVMVQK